MYGAHFGVSSRQGNQEGGEGQRRMSALLLLLLLLLLRTPRQVGPQSP
jgi:hypothetical protein